MRVAVLDDIHGNLPALEAVLEDVAQARVDRVVVGGDVLPGPMPLETIARLRGLSVPVDFIYGNCEVAALEAAAGKTPAAVPEQYRPLFDWTARAIRGEAERFVARWPKTCRLDIPGIGDVLFCHGTPRDENEGFTRLTPEDLLRPLFQDARASLVVCGHTHMQFDRTIGGVRVVNAGSVGMPFQEPGAYWLLLGPGVELRRTSYDLDKAAARIRATDYPDAENYAANYVLKPPSEAAMLEAFTKASIKALTPVAQ
jgi:putative phosphoesterase